MIQVAVMGYGTIGSGVVEVLETNKDKITEKTGKEIAVKYILDLREFPGDPHSGRIEHGDQKRAAGGSPRTGWRIAYPQQDRAVVANTPFTVP